jgi:hypothetical protein
MGVDGHYCLPEIVESGRGGAIITWQDFRHAGPDLVNADMYAQALGADGSIIFRTNGIPVTTAPKWQNISNSYKRSIALTDTTGVAVVVWADGRDSTAAGKDPGQIYASRIVLPPPIVTGSVNGFHESRMSTGLTRTIPTTSIPARRSPIISRSGRTWS